MDIGDLGFLIIAFIVFIVNFFVKAKKEKAQAQVEKQKPAIPELPEPWEVEETLPPTFDYPFTREKKVEVIKRKTVLSPLAPTAQESYETKRARLQSEEGVSSLSESLFKEDNLDSISYQDEDSIGGTSYTNDLFHGNITEELKKVIIYSEILNRKYE